MLYLAPLRKDVKSPWAPKSDEEEIKKEGADDKGKDKKDEKADKGGDKGKDSKEAAADDGISGDWSGKATGPVESGFPPDGIGFTFHLTLHADGSVTGTIDSDMGNGQITTGKYNKETGELTL